MYGHCRHIVGAGGGWGSGLVAQLYACPTGDQEVASLIPTVSGNILVWRLVMTYILRSFSPFGWKNECAQTLFRKLSLHRKSVVR